MLNVIRVVAKGGFANLREVRSWHMGFALNHMQSLELAFLVAEELEKR